MSDFSVDYYSIDVNNTVEIHKYLMKRHDISFGESLPPNPEGRITN